MATFQDIIEKQLQFINDRNWDKFNSPKDLSMAMAVEAGELMENFMWIKEHHIQNLETQFPHLYENAKEEIADVFLYLIRLCDTLKIDLLEVAGAKIQKNGVKYSVEKGRALADSLT